MTEDEMAEFRSWKAARQERERKRGFYWLTPEGRNEIRDIWPEEDDGSVVRPLFDHVEAVEAVVLRILAAYDAWDNRCPVPTELDNAVEAARTLIERTSTEVI